MFRFDLKDIAITTTIGLVGILGLFVVSRMTRKKTVTFRDVARLKKLPDCCKVRVGKFTDLTQEMTHDTILFPGDPVFDCKKLSSLAQGDSFELKQFTFGNHTGTHIDFPSHVIKGGKTSSDFNINDLIGNGIIIELPKNTSSITRKTVLSSCIQKGALVFFKTLNSHLLKKNVFSEDFVYIEPDAAEALLEKKIRVVGVDYISPDKCDAEDLPVHNILLSHDVLIVEGLNLYDINSGRCKLFILPLKVPEMDGLPTRVLMQR